jgi:hypothetical protein
MDAVQQIAVEAAIDALPTTSSQVGSVTGICTVPSPFAQLRQERARAPQSLL